MSLERKKIVYICSPLRGNIDNNLDRVKEHCRSAVLADAIPIAPHLFFTQFLDDAVPGERDLGIACGLELMDLCDEIWVYDSNGISEGMKTEISYANEKSIPVFYK